MEKLIRSRPLRIVVSVGMLAAGAWAFFPHVFHRVSSSAFVNAELVRVNSPIAGQLTADLPPKGTVISSADSLLLVEAHSPDRRQLAIYEQEHAVATARIAYAAAQLEQLSESDRQLRERIEQYQQAMLERLAREMDEADANIKACQARREELAKQQTRIESLAKTGFASRQRMEEIQSASASAIATCEAATARFDRLRSVSGSAKQGIFLQDGYNDTPYSQQQRDRLILRQQELEGEVVRERARLAQLEGEIEKEGRRVARTSQYHLSLPANHVVWTITASPGGQVVEGQSIMDLANCDNRFVIVELPERDFEAVVPGGHADVRLLGSEVWIQGTIQQILGSAARQDERLLAAQTPKPEGHRVTVEVSLPAESLPTQIGRYCDIGRMAEVRIGRIAEGGFGRGQSELIGELTELAIRLLQKAAAIRDRVAAEIRS